MGRKAVFLDVDGTYANKPRSGAGSARRAVVQARANGHLVFLCTGRSPNLILDHIAAAGFDGIIASAGGYVELGGQVLLHRSVPVPDVRHVVEFFDALGVGYLLEAPTGVYGSRHSKTRLRAALYAGVTDEGTRAELERGLGGFLDSLIVNGDLIRSDIAKVSFFDSGVRIETIRAEFAGRFDVIPASVPMFGPNSGEMSLPGVHKASAIEVLLEHVGVSREDTLAYGDGPNDVEMIAFVATGVAMADAHPDVKALADAVTAGPDEDGIYTSFVTLGLI